MATSDPIYGTVLFGTDPYLTARVKANVGGAKTDVTRAMVSAVTYAVTDDDGTAVGSPGSLTVASVVFDTLQTGDVASAPYNFAFWLDRAYLPAPDVTYTVKVTVVLTGGTHEVVWYEITVVG